MYDGELRGEAFSSFQLQEHKPFRCHTRWHQTNLRNVARHTVAPMHEAKNTNIPSVRNTKCLNYCACRIDVTGPIRSVERARNNTSEASHLPWIMPMDCHKDPGKNMIAHVSLSGSARPTTQINISRLFNIFKGIQKWHLLWHPLPKRPSGFHCGQLQKVAVTRTK